MADSAAEPGPADAVEMSDEKKAEKDAKAAAKKAEKEAKKLKALEKARKAEQEKAAKESAGGSSKAKAKAEAKEKAEAEAEATNRAIAAAAATPVGEKKDVKEEPKGYHPKFVEAGWYEWWAKCGFFKPDMDSDKEPFVIVIPPPNVTGALHIGHALTNSVQDTIVRWHRMNGRNALWVPGTDHAGIATQTVVEKKLQREQGRTRHDLGRETFVAEVWNWVGEYGQRIWSQQRRMGISVDWDRSVFTMDDKLSVAVREAFVRFHADGLIFRDNRLVNWCCKLRTAVSDIEVDYLDVPGRTLLPVPGYAEPVEFGVIISFAYPMEGDAGEEVVVATTRIETMLGDVAIAVHSSDERYKKFHGKFAIHPVHGRRIPIITDDELVDPTFGTGAVKITPAHDPNDFKAGQRHKLPQINIFDDSGNINEHGGQFQGQPRFQARVTVTQFLEEKGLFRGKKDNAMALPLCSRSKDIIEPVLKPQWWVNCKQMAADACAAVRAGDLQIIPADFEATWFRWLDDCRDWCISRQLWWGHRIPAFYVVLEGEAPEAAGLPGGPTERSDRWVVGRDEPEARAAAEQRYPGQAFTLQQDEDVLDTWFSSGLFPFSVFGWPNETPDLAKFYPTSLLETGHDILFFWVARMVMMGMQLTGKVPFSQVYLHAMVRDAHGRKMSKSLGNVIDPIHVIEGITLEGLHQTLEGGNLDPREKAKACAGQAIDYPDGIEECGTDALRFALCSYTAQGRDINLDIKRVVAYRHWCNKLWNAIRFAMQHLAAPFAPAAAAAAPPAGAPFACAWILTRLHRTAAVVNEKMALYEFAPTTQAIYAFWQYDVCDYFIELIKPVFQGSDAAAKDACRQALYTTLESGLRLLHPFMPFVTEELWQRLPRRPGAAPPSIMLAAYPTAESCASGDAGDAVLSEMEYVQAVIRSARAQRTSAGLKPNQAPRMFVSCKDGTLRAQLTAHAASIATMTGNSGCEVLEAGAEAPRSCAVELVDGNTGIYLDLKGTVDPAVEVKKFQKQEQETLKRREQLLAKMAMASYQANTPAEIVQKDEARAAELAAELAIIQKAIADMTALGLES